MLIDQDLGISKVVGVQGFEPWLLTRAHFGTTATKPGEKI
jgi:hypothetical protein